MIALCTMHNQLHVAVNHFDASPSAELVSFLHKNARLARGLTELVEQPCTVVPLLRITAFHRVAAFIFSAPCPLLFAPSLGPAEGPPATRRRPSAQCATTYWCIRVGKPFGRLILQGLKPWETRVDYG